MTLNEISNLTIESTLDVLLRRILDTSNLPDGAKVYMLDLDENIPFYDRILVHQSLVKPPLPNLQAELTQYKQELAAVEQERLDEIARVQELTSRFNAIPDIRGAIQDLNAEIPNPALELKRIIGENDTAKLVQLEASSSSFQQKLADKATLKEQSDMVDGLVEICLSCIKIVMKHNIANSLTKEQKDQQATTYADVFTAIRDWRPGKAKSLITALNPDGTLVTQALKDELLTFLTSKGL